MTKKSSPRNKEWEKDRRDRLNRTFDNLAKLLPQYDPSSPFSKIEILQKTIVFIEELQKKQNDLLQSEFDKVLLKEREEFEKNITILRYRNSQLADLLRQANITIPTFKAQQFAKNLSEKQVENLQEENNANGINTKPEKPKKYSNRLSTEQIDKARENEEQVKKRGKKSTPKNKLSENEDAKKTKKCKSAKSKEKIGGKQEEKSTVDTSTSAIQTSSTILSYPEAHKAVSPQGISAISSKNVTITHTSLTTPIMATGFIPVPVIQTSVRPVLILNTSSTLVNPQTKDVTKNGKKKHKGRFIQIRPQATPVRIPFGKIPIPALRSTYIKKKKRVIRRKVKVKEKLKPIERTVTPPKRKSSDEKDVVEKKKSKLEEENSDKMESKCVEEKSEENSKQKETEKFQKGGNEVSSDHHEISAPLSHSDLSNDIFASLQVPSGGSNTGCLSPTAAFLMTFPVVSSAGGGKNPETTLSEESTNNPVNTGTQHIEKDQEVENNSALLENLSSFFNTRDDYSSVYPPDNIEKSAQKIPDKGATSSASSNLIRIRTDMGATPQKIMNVPTSTSYSDSTFSTFDYNCSAKISTSSVFSGYSSVPLLPEIAPAISTKSEFTFSLTKTSTSAPCTSYKTDSLYNPFNLGTTSNNISCSIGPTMDTNLSVPLPLSISSTIYPNVSEDISGKTQDSFTFSLTNTTSTPSYYSKTSTNLNISFPSNDTYNAYNPFSYNDPVGIKQSTDTGTNFSFCLTTTAAKTTPIYTFTSTYNTLNPFSIDATLQSSNYRHQNYESSKNYQFYPNQGQKTATNHKQSNKGYQQREVSRSQLPQQQQQQQQQQKSPNKKTHNQQSKYHNVNWMTNSDYPKNNEFCLPPPLDFTHGSNAGSFSYPPPPPPTLGSIDLKNKSDVFFAHPPGEENFSWSPNKLSNVLEPPSIHNYLPQAPLPTLHGDLALNTTMPSVGSVTQDGGKDKTNQQQTTIDNNYQVQQQQSGNFLSVSQLLVEQTKKTKKSKNPKHEDSSRKAARQEKKQYPCINTQSIYPSDVNYNDSSKGNQQQYSNIYSAESLIGYKKDRVSQQNYHQPAPLDLPSTGSNLFPGIDMNNDVNYNPNILFNPPTNTTFVPAAQTCMSVFPENDFYDYSAKSGVTKCSQQQNYYMNKSHQNNLSMDMKTTNSTASYSNKYNSSQSTGKMKKTSSSKLPDFYPPPPPPPPPIPNYDPTVSSSNYFSVPLGVNSPHLPPTEDHFHLHHFNYSNPLKNLAPTNSSLYLPEGTNAPNSSNSLTNFHLSSICPEINDKVRQQNW